MKNNNNINKPELTDKIKIKIKNFGIIGIEKAAQWPMRKI